MGLLPSGIGFFGKGTFATRVRQTLSSFYVILSLTPQTARRREEGVNGKGITPLLLQSARRWDGGGTARNGRRSRPQRFVAAGEAGNGNGASPPPSPAIERSVKRETMESAVGAVLGPERAEAELVRLAGLACMLCLSSRWPAATLVGSAVDMEPTSRYGFSATEAARWCEGYTAVAGQDNIGTG